MKTDTIVAIATPPGVGGVGIIRISGPAAREILGRFFDSGGRKIEPRLAVFGWVLDRAHVRLDNGIALFFKGPSSFTGEDVLELQLHGSPYVLNQVVEQICDSGLARLAEPGEFTRRALMNGKLTLEEVERLDLLIHAETAFESRVATASRGRFGKVLGEIRGQLVESMAAIEAGIEYPDEESETADSVGRAIAGLERAWELLHALAVRFEEMGPIRQGLRVVLTGPPNVGKSSLLNRIVGYERVLVTDRPGTTRDAVAVDVIWQGRKLTLVDTAGVRSGGGSIEEMGMVQAAREIADADVIVEIRDATGNGDQWKRNVACAAGKRIVRVVNKVDLAAPSLASGELGVSAKTGEGINDLLAELAGRESDIPEDGMVLFSQRQYRAAKKASRYVREAMDALGRDMPEIAQRECQEAVHWLDALSGRITTEDMLDALFSSFCLGK